MAEGGKANRGGDPISETGPIGAELVELVRRCGCAIVERHRLWSGREAVEIHCPSHQAKVNLLAALAEWDSKRPKVIELARQLAADTPGGPEQVARAIHAWVLERVRFFPESRELFRSTERTIEDGIGDCDDAARALLALYRAAGLRAGLATLNKPPSHVAVAVELGGKWLWAEATVPGAQLGEHPRAAVRRTLRARPELAGLEPEQARALRASMVEFGALAAVALGFRAAWDRRMPTSEEALLALVGGAWTPVVIMSVQQAWRRWTEGPREPEGPPEPTEAPSKPDPGVGPFL